MALRRSATDWRDGVGEISRQPRPGDLLIVRGVLTSAPGRIRGDPVAGRVRQASLELISRSRNPLFSVGNALRSRVGDRLAGRDEDREAAALLRGFLIGDNKRPGPPATSRPYVAPVCRTSLRCRAATSRSFWRAGGS